MAALAMQEDVLAEADKADDADAVDKLQQTVVCHLLKHLAAANSG